MKVGVVTEVSPELQLAQSCNARAGSTPITSSRRTRVADTNQGARTAEQARARALIVPREHGA